MENSNPALTYAVCKIKPRMNDMPEGESRNQSLEADTAATAVVWQSPSSQDTKAW